MNIRKIVVAVVCFGLTSLALDRYLNLTRITPPILKYYNDEFGALNTPNIEYLKVKEGLFLGRTNYDGRFRENYPKRRTDPRAVRIILVGDSFVEGIDVFSRNHFAAIMEKTLSARLGRNVEILDFGRGNCTIQPSSYYYINHIKKEYDADLVLFFTEARDLEEVTIYPSTAFVYDPATGGLRASYLWRESPDYRLTRKLQDLGILGALNGSGWFRLAYRARSGIEMYGFLPKVLGKFYGEVPAQNYDRTEMNQAASMTTQKIFDTLSKESAPPVWFVVRNFPLESKHLERYMDSLGFRYIDLADTLDFKTIRGTKDDAYFFKTTGAYGGHWNHLGHKAVGAFLSDRILKEMRQGRIKFK